MPSTTLKLTVNIPVHLNVTGAVIWPGKLWTDPKDGTQKQLPAQLALKGNVLGTSDPVTVYVPADLGSALVTAGATKREVSSKDSKGMAFDLPMNRRVWEVCKRQAAGEKHPHTELYEPGEREPLTETPRPLTGPPEVMPWEPQEAPTPAEPVVAPRESAALRLYRDTFEWMMALTKPYLEAADPAVVFTGQDIAAMTATAYIQRNKAGEIPVSRG